MDGGAVGGGLAAEIWTSLSFWVLGEDGVEVALVAVLAVVNVAVHVAVVAVALLFAVLLVRWE